MKTVKELKQEVLEANKQIPELKLAIFTFGNVSAYYPELGLVGIKPSGVSYDKLKADDIVVLDLEGNIKEGTLRPSSDTPTHLHLYRHFPDIGGVVHTHSTHATAWAQAGRSIPVYGTTHADHSPVAIPCAPIMSEDRIMKDYEVETGLQITEYLKAQNINPEYCQMVLIEGHGPFTWGATPSKALYNAAVLEELAQMAKLTESIYGGQKNGLPEYLVQKHFQRKHGPNAYYGQK
ncbi:L-ribulose-5-phosphate 4-epimerase AraD [Spirochaeta cellobiosiphila]|uniref:L-ribulose-5-phosphate 4-epimerase AraD n=1 Tax=Spirochaeta cellobiosiphila TaxID=504483 RepID=UPI00040E9000|nr:L-ribulose-5-phosphate 4-epimerase AraD [Spirochaeta cellobiosiphila]